MKNKSYLPNECLGQWWHPKFPLLQIFILSSRILNEPSGVRAVPLQEPLKYPMKTYKHFSILNFQFHGFHGGDPTIEPTLEDIMPTKLVGDAVPELTRTITHCAWRTSQHNIHTGSKLLNKTTRIKLVWRTFSFICYPKGAELLFQSCWFPQNRHAQTSVQQRKDLTGPIHLAAKTGKFNGWPL